MRTPFVLSSFVALALGAAAVMAQERPGCRCCGSHADAHGLQ